MLGDHISPANADSVKFVFANVPVYDFRLSRSRVEMPLSVRFHQRNRHGPVVRPHFKCDLFDALFYLIATLGHGGGKTLGIICVLYFVPDLKRVILRAKNSSQSFLIPGFRGCSQGFDGLLRRSELLFRDDRTGWNRLRLLRIKAGWHSPADASQQNAGHQAEKPGQQVRNFHTFNSCGLILDDVDPLPASALASTAMSAAGGVRYRMTFGSPMAVIAHIAPPVIAAAEEIDIRLRGHHYAAITAAAHPAHTARQTGQHDKDQRYLKPVNQNINPLHNC